jgi:hypothetical protein
MSTIEDGRRDKRVTAILLDGEAYPLNNKGHHVTRVAPSKRRDLRRIYGPISRPLAQTPVAVKPLQSTLDDFEPQPFALQMGIPAEDAFAFEPHPAWMVGNDEQMGLHCGLGILNMF